MASTTINRGNVLYTVVMAVNLTPAATNATTTAEQIFTVPGVIAGDQVSGLTYNAAWTTQLSIDNFRVVGNNQIGISFNNGTAGSLTAPSGQYLIEINHPESLPLPANAG